VHGQAAETAVDTEDLSNEDAPSAPERVDVEPLAEDTQIADRLKNILEATDWFREASVRVDEGVVFLAGKTAETEHRQWAGQLASKTQDVVAVVNRIRVDVPDLFDFSSAWAELRQMARSFVQSLPTLVAGLILLVVSWIVAKAAAGVTRRINKRRITTPLLREVIAKLVAIPVLLLGVYVALRITGLTQLAATVLGGTGLLGIVLGIAFRDIAENFLASLLISVQRPFIAGDLVTIDGYEGFVQGVTTRGTQLMTLDGNHVQIPNSVVYKNVIENASANPNLRLSFVVGIDYSDSATDAQAVVLKALRSHESVLANPEPLVLVEDLASSTVNLGVYFWVDGQKFSSLRVRSAILRRVKIALQEAGLTLPDESREMIFPQGVPVQIVEQTSPTTLSKSRQHSPQDSNAEIKVNKPAAESDSSSTESEGGLRPDSSDINQQAAHSRQLEAGADLIEKQIVD